MRLDRLDSMEQYILANGTASLETLMQTFHISINTVRRDIAELEKRGAITRVYGGVAAVQRKTPIPIPVRAELNSAAKEQIGRRAAQLVQDNQTVYIDSGSTTVCMIKHLQNKNGVTLVTHSLNALCEAAKYHNLNVIALGGMFNWMTGSYVGASTARSISDMNFDIAFMAATGVSMQSGLSNSTYLEAEIKRCVPPCSKEVVLLADASKFDHAALITFCALTDLSTIVTNTHPDAAYLEFFAEHNIRLLCTEEVAQ